MWHSMLIMALLVLSIDFVQYNVELLVDVLNALNKAVIHFKWLQMVWPHQWGIMVEISALPERDCDLLSYGEICCSCGGHRGDFHPMCMDASSCTCAKCVQSSC